MLGVFSKKVAGMEMDCSRHLRVGVFIMQSLLLTESLERNWLGEVVAASRPNCPIRKQNPQRFRFPPAEVCHIITYCSLFRRSSGSQHHNGHHWRRSSGACNFQDECCYHRFLMKS